MDYESRINTALGKILRYFNFLELNLGLCLRALASPTDVNASHSLLRHLGMSGTINRLRTLLREYEHITDIDAFEKWAMNAEKIRPLRNYYVHATWEYLPRRKGGPLAFRIPPWRTEQIKGRSQGAMSLEDLEADAERVKTVFEEFRSVRRRYGV